jgi:hypothetical protein
LDSYGVLGEYICGFPGLGMKRDCVGIKDLDEKYSS